MKITKSELHRLIREEFVRLREGSDTIGKPLFSLAGLMGQDYMGAPIARLKPTDFDDWRSKLPAEFKMPCITKQGVAAVPVSKQIYMPFLEAFYKFIGMGDVEEGVNKVSGMSIDEFHSKMGLFKSIEKGAGAGQVAGALRIQKNILLNDLIAQHDEFSRYLIFKMTRFGVPQPWVWPLVSELTFEEVTEEMITPAMADLDKAIMFSQYAAQK